MASLAQFLENDSKLDAKIVSFMTQTLQLKSISDFAHFWTSADFENGVQADVVKQVASFKDISSPAAKLQIARLRAAWKSAQDSPVAPTAPVAAKGPNAAKAADAAECVGMGWTSPDISASSWDDLWATLVLKARNPQKFKMDVSNVVVVDRPGFLARSMTIIPTGKRVEEHIYASERKGEMIYRLVDPESKRESGDERVIAVKEQPLRLEFFHRHVSDGYRTYWQAPLTSVKQMVQEIVNYAANSKGTGVVVGLGIRSDEVTGVSHDSLWRSMMLSIREPARFLPCSNVSVSEKQGFVQRAMSVGCESYLENIYTDESCCEIVFRKLSNGAESEVERVVALRTHPLQIEFHQRNVADGFRAQWDMPKSAPLSAVEAFVREARRMDGIQPTTVGYGITSDPIRECSYDSLYAAVELSIKEPWRAIEVEREECSIEDCAGFTLRKMKLKSSGERVVERIIINEELGSVSYNKCDSNGRPSDVERVLAIHTPLSLEFYERSARSGLRVNWKAPWDIARDTFSNIVQLAKQIETRSSEVVSYGLASKPISGLSQDTVWKAMLFAMRNPAECGMKVDNTSVSDMSGFMQRTMRLLEKPGSPSVIDNIRVIESSQEITYRLVTGKVESVEERVFALRTDPLRFEIFCRNTKDNMRLDWQAPRSICTGIFDMTVTAAKRMADPNMSQGVLTKPSTDFEDLGHFELEKGFKWSKSAWLQDGRLLFTPFNHASILLFSPATMTWEFVGKFEGDCKWSGCAVLPTGKVVFVPQYSAVILIFDPAAGTWEEVPVDPEWQKPTDPKAKAQPKFSDCLALPDGKVLFVPYYHPSIVLFDPVTKVCEQVGRFDGGAKWNGCRLLPDGRVVCVPFSSSSILLFDPRNMTWDMVGNFEGGFKWSGIEVLPDGRVLFAPLKNRSALLFSPQTRSWEEVGDFGEGMKWNGCRLLPDGRVVFVPLDSSNVVVFDPRSKTWEERAHGKPRRMSSDCAPLPDGRVLFVPCSCQEIVLFTPSAPVVAGVRLEKGSEVFAGKTNYVTVAAAGSGKLYCAPFSADSALMIDPVTGSSQRLGALGPVQHKYASMIQHSNGKFYSPPFSAEKCLVIDPAAGTAAELGASFGPGHAKWECIAEGDDGRLYCAPANNHRVLRIDPAGSADEVGPTIGEEAAGPTGHYTSLKKAANGKLYSPPLNATRVLMVDPASDTIAEIGEKLGVGGGSCTAGVPGKGGPDSDKWWKMAMADDGKFYCPPCNALRVLVIDPATDSVYKIGPYFVGDSKWGCVVKAPNGKLYSPPRDAERVLMINPTNGQVAEIGPSFGQGGDKWSAIVLGKDGKLYCPPRGGSTVLVIDPTADDAMEVPAPVSQGGKWQWMDAMMGAGGTITSPPCMADRILRITPQGSCVRRVLVTGAGGKTGSLTLSKMAKRADMIAAAGTSRTEASAVKIRAATGADCQVCDVCDPASMGTVLASVDTLVILHSATPKMAGKAPTGAPLFEYPAGGEPEKVDWEGGRALIDAAKLAGVKHIVYVSSMGGTQPDHFLNKIKTSSTGSKPQADGNIILWKRKTEMYLVASGIPYTIIHPGGLLPHFGNDIVPDSERELVVGLDDALTSLPQTSRTIPRGDVAELVVQCVLDQETAFGRSFDVISHPPNPEKAWNKNLLSLLSPLGGRNSNYAKIQHPILTC